jgi:hypothetical protein
VDALTPDFWQNTLPLIITILVADVGVLVFMCWSYRRIHKRIDAIEATVRRLDATLDRIEVTCGRIGASCGRVVEDRFDGGRVRLIEHERERRRGV